MSFIDDKNRWNYGWLIIVAIVAFMFFIAFGGFPGIVMRNPMKEHTSSPISSPSNDMSKLILVCEKSERNGDGYSFFRVYRFEDNNNTHYIAINTSGAIAIK